MKIEALKKYRCIAKGNEFTKNFIYVSARDNFLIDDYSISRYVEYPERFALAEESKTIVYPEMKYKIGDKVKILSCKYGHEFKLGEIVTIKRVNDLGDKHYDSVSDKGDNWSVKDDEIEAAESPVMNIEPKVYILQRDLPTAKIGTEFTFTPNSGYAYTHENGDKGYIKEWIVESKSEWFLPKKVEPKEFTESDMIELAKDTQRTYYGCKEGAERGAIEWINKKRKCSNTA